MSFARASLKFAAASSNAAAMVLAQTTAAALRGDDPVSRALRGAVEGMRDLAAQSMVFAFAEGLAELVTPDAPWVSSDAGVRTRSEEWQSEVRSRQASESFAERLPLP